jgi:sugar/nucleoside kinase (ribokinase family)
VPHVVCAGILVADVFVPPLERLPGPGELIATGEFLLEPGGCAANTAIGLRRQGLDVSIVGCVGDDAFGERVERDLRAHGIDTSGIRRVGTGTSMTVIVPVTGEDRRYIHTFGANAALCAGDLDLAMLETADAVYIGGYLLLPGLRGPALAERLAAARGRVVLTVAVPEGAAVSAEDVTSVLPHLDWFVANEHEAAVLTGEREPERQVEWLCEHGAQSVAITLGDRGAVVAAGDEHFAVPAQTVEVVEPSGAGDAFDAGLIAGLVAGLDTRTCVEWATVLGASACTALGCWEGVLTRAELEAQLA